MSEPIQPQFRAAMNEIAEALDDIFNGAGERKVGFVLLSFEFGKTDGGRVNYISNGERCDMIAAMREFLGRAEGRVSDEPRRPQ